MDLDRALTLLEGIGTADCIPWRTKILARFPGAALHLAKVYRRIAKEKSHIEANRWLLGISQQLKLGGTGLSLAGSLEQLDDYCKAKARKTQRQIHEIVPLVGKELTPDIIREIVDQSGIKFPLESAHTEDELIAALARVCDEKWWKRQLRPKQWREMEDFLRDAGVVNRHKEPYISNFSLNRRLAQKRNNRQLLENLEAVNEEGQVYTLAELADLSPSNPLVRRSELMVRMRGFEDFAANSTEKYCGMFYTLTCPSKYHAVLGHGVKNAKYNGSTVSDSQEYLNAVWRRVRAAFKRKGIEPFGFRVAEPHHDGTPHWHLMLFIAVDQAELATNILKRYAFEEDGDEPGAEAHRLKAVSIDPKIGSATGYIAKYISKNIDGYQVGVDHYGRDAVESAIRIEAWASIHNIRQFQQIGGASVTVWRELRRINNTEVPAGLMSELVSAADNGDWEGYNALMGGVVCSRKERPLRPMMIERPELNQYGELVKIIKGIWHGPLAIVTRIHDWIVRPKQECATSNSGEDGIGPGAAQCTAPPLGGACAPLEFCQ